MLDVHALRQRFPALASGAAYLDGPGGSQAPQEVLDAVDGYLRGSNANLGGAFPTSAASDELIDAAARPPPSSPAATRTDRVRRQHDDASSCSRTRSAAARAGDEIVVTRSITTPTCRRGCSWRRTATSSCEPRRSAPTT